MLHDENPDAHQLLSINKASQLGLFSAEKAHALERVTSSGSLASCRLNHTSQGRSSLFTLSAEYADQLLDDFLLLGPVFRVHRAVNAMAEVLAQKIALDACKSRSRGFDLSHHVDAVSVGLNHLGDAAYLPLDPIEILQRFVGRRFFYVYPSRVLELIPL